MEMQIKLREGLVIDVEYEYQPEEKQTREYPGCAEELWVTKISMVQGGIFDLIYYLNLEEKISEIALKQLHDEKDMAMEP